MKFQSLSHLLLLAAAESVTAKFCNTYYATTSPSSIPTSTYTATVDRTVKTTEYSYVYATSTSTFTYLSIVGKKAVTVPVDPKFTPLTSVSTVTGTYQVGKRSPDLVARSSGPGPSPSYPASVVCTKFATVTHYKVKTIQTTGTAVVYTAVTKTTTVATSTAFAACAPTANNILTKFDGKYVFPWTSDGTGIDACNDPSFGNATRAAACLNERTCCEGAQRGSYDGFSFMYNDRGFHTCAYISGNWTFANLVDYDQGYILGNGKAGKASYEYLVTKNCCGGS